MKTYSKCYALLLATLLLPLLFNCKKETPKVIPTVTLTAVTNITANSASAGGSVKADGGDPVTARGVCWSSTNATPTASDSKTSDGTGTGSFTSSISGLAQGTIYNIRAYSTNSVGTGYSSTSSFKTLAIAPTLTTTDFSAVTANSLICGGNITNDGGSPITARGVCWSTNQNPTITDNKSSDGTGTGIFTSSIAGLTSGTTYYVRAYSTNSIGTSYGNQISTKTSATIPTITTTASSSITSSTATSGGNVTSDGGAAVTARGVCWSTSENPTTTNSKTSDGTGIGSFTSSIIGLTAVTTYYVRAYATNSVGTAYGNEVSFKTISISDIDGNVYNMVTIGTQIWMASNLKTTKYNDGTPIPLVTDNTAWSNLETPGYCWYNNDAAANKNTYGALYNWYTVNTGKLCPTGWHMPSDAEWTVLTSYLGGESVAGGKLKETGTSHWLSPNAYATNTTGFTALPGGYRYRLGEFLYIGFNGFWWSSSEYDTNYVWYRFMRYYSSDASRDVFYRENGFSVRCLRD